MALWQIALIALVFAWGLQSAGVWLQTRHYSRMFAELRGRWSDGEMGAGAAASRFGKGVIALLVVGPSGDVRAARAMIGRSVFAKFAPVPGLEGLSLDALKAHIESPEFDGAKRIAFTKAVEQVERIRGERAAGRGAAVISNEESARAGNPGAIREGAAC